jgi:beta-N-acetylhexosaminidase
VSRRERRAPRALRELQQETASRQRRRATRRRTIRRRRLTGLGVLVALVVIAGAAIALSSGSGSQAPAFRPGPIGTARTITPAAPSGSPAPTAHVPAFHPSPTATRVAATMTLPQQVAQLFLVSLDGTDQTAVSGLGSTPWGGVAFTGSNFVSDSQVGSLASAVVSAAHNATAIPPLLTAAQAGGFGTALRDLPPAAEQAIGETGRPAVAEAQAIAAATALKHLGFRMTIAPWVDVDNPQGALTGDLFSTDPGAVSRFAVAALNGYAQAGIIAAAAHFPGEGGASADPDAMTATVGGSLAALRGRDLIPFVAIASRAPVIVMSNAAYVAFDGVTPASLLPAAVSLLRSLGFGGVVMSDDLDATLNATGQSPGEVALAALRAGDDLLYIGGPPSEHAAAYGAVLAAASHSAADRAFVHRALLRVLTLKARYGLLH